MWFPILLPFDSIHPHGILEGDPVKIRFVLPALAAILGLSCDGPTGPYEDFRKLYPTVLRPLPPADLDSAKARLNAKLGTFYKATLDNFGLLGSSGFLSRGRSSMTDTAQALSIVKQGFVRLSEFSGVRDTADLVVAEIRHGLNVVLTDWAISFSLQRYDGMEVHGTWLYSILTDSSLDLRNHHYGEFYIPPFNVISRSEAREYWIGRDIEYHCWVPSVHHITDESIDTGEIERCVYPLASPDSVVMHVAWKIPVKPYGQPMWFIYTDVITGELIAMEQLFIC